MSTNLTENEKRDIIKYLEAGKPLPDKYRFLLFKDREVELVWNGKTNEVTNVVLPFQIIEQIDEPREGKEFGDGGTLFDTSGKQIHGWTNKLIWGDNKLILSSLKNGPLRKEIEAQGGLKLIYIDPPFDVGADFSMPINIGDNEDEESFTKRPSVIEEIAFRDTWGNGVDSFIAMIYERLKMMHDLLAEDGSIYVHCDWRVSSFMRLVLDEIFGEINFCNEIAWKRGHTVKNTSGSQFPRNHDILLFYSKNQNQNNFNSSYGTYADGTLSNYNKDDNDGKGKYRLQSLRTYGADSIKSFEDRGLIYKTGSGKLWLKQFLYDRSGPKIDDFWDDISSIEIKREEQLNYPTQKPEGLLERIIKSSTNENDLIADFFCGSGTTLAVAEKLGRKWIGSDLGKFGVHTTRKRMIGVQRELKKEGKNFRAFEILNVGRYERESFISTNDDLRAEEKAKQVAQKERQFVSLILSAYKAEPVESFDNFVGKKRDRLVAIGPINLPVSSKFIGDIVYECRKKNLTKIDVLGFDYEMGLNFSEYSDDGIDVTFKIIPREVFDKRAIERGQVKFYDVAFIECKPIVSGKGATKELSIELSDFSVFYNQDNTGEIEQELRAGGTKVVVENGQVIKISKDKKTEIVTREVLTKKWSDWIDYWAVDYNFTDRKEYIRFNDVETGLERTVWTGDHIFDNEWQEFRTKKKRNLELVSAMKELPKGTYKVAVKVVDIFGNDTTKVIEVKI